MSSVMVQKYKAILSTFEKKLENNLGASVSGCFFSLTFPFGAAAGLWKAGYHPREASGLTWCRC